MDTINTIGIREKKTNSLALEMSVKVGDFPRVEKYSRVFLRTRDCVLLLLTDIILKKRPFSLSIAINAFTAVRNEIFDDIVMNR